MKASDQIPEQIDDDSELALLQQQFSIEPPTELDLRVKQTFRDNLAQQQAQSNVFCTTDQSWYQQLLVYWKLFRQTPAIAGTLVAMSLLTGVLSGLLLPSPWQDQQQPMQPANTEMVLRNGNSATELTDNSENPDVWLESIAELLVQQRVEEAQIQLQAFKKRYPDLGVTGNSD